MSGGPALASAAVALTSLLAACSAAFAQSSSPAPPRHAEPPGAAAQVLAPDFTRRDLTGRTFRLSDYRGKVVLLNFWATWCEPCLAEIQTFSRWQRKYGADGLQVLGVSMDDDAAVVVEAVDKYAVPYPVAMGDEHVGALYGGVLGLPLSYLIDSSGRIVARYQGEPDLAALESRLTALLPRRRR